MTHLNQPAHLLHHEDPADSELVQDRTVGWVLLVAGLVGFTAAFILAVEKYWLLTNPFYWEKTQHGISKHTAAELEHALAATEAAPA